jgi:hypothetical protein
MRRQPRNTWIAFGAALVLAAGAGRADDKQKTGTATPGQGGERAASKELSGRVVQSGPSKLFVEHMGAVVEFNIAPDAQFSGGDIKSGSDLKEGQEVRTSFTVQNSTTNVAKRVTVAQEPAGTQPGRAPEQGSTTPQSSSPSAPPRTPPPLEPGTPSAPK